MASTSETLFTVRANLAGFQEVQSALSGVEQAITNVKGTADQLPESMQKVNDSVKDVGNSFSSMMQNGQFSDDFLSTFSAMPVQVQTAVNAMAQSLTQSANSLKTVLSSAGNGFTDSIENGLKGGSAYLTQNMKQLEDMRQLATELSTSFSGQFSQGLTKSFESLIMSIPKIITSGMGAMTVGAMEKTLMQDKTYKSGMEAIQRTFNVSDKQASMMTRLGALSTVSRMQNEDYVNAVARASAGAIRTNAAYNAPTSFMQRLPERFRSLSEVPQNVMNSKQRLNYEEANLRKLNEKEYDAVSKLVENNYSFEKALNMAGVQTRHNGRFGLPSMDRLPKYVIDEALGHLHKDILNPTLEGAPNYYKPIDSNDLTERERKARASKNGTVPQEVINAYRALAQYDFNPVYSNDNLAGQPNFKIDRGYRRLNNNLVIRPDSYQIASLGYEDFLTGTLPTNKSRFIEDPHGDNKQAQGETVNKMIQQSLYTDLLGMEGDLTYGNGSKTDGSKRAMIQLDLRDRLLQKREDGSLVYGSDGHAKENEETREIIKNLFTKNKTLTYGDGKQYGYASRKIGDSTYVPTNIKNGVITWAREDLYRNAAQSSLDRFGFNIFDALEDMNGEYGSVEQLSKALDVRNRSLTPSKTFAELGARLPSKEEMAFVNLKDVTGLDGPMYMMPGYLPSKALTVRGLGIKGLAQQVDFHQMIKDLYGEDIEHFYAPKITTKGDENKEMLELFKTGGIEAVRNNEKYGQKAIDEYFVDLMQAKGIVTDSTIKSSFYTKGASYEDVKDRFYGVAQYLGGKNGIAGGFRGVQTAKGFLADQDSLSRQMSSYLDMSVEQAQTEIEKWDTHINKLRNDDQYAIETLFSDKTDPLAEAIRQNPGLLHSNSEAIAIRNNAIDAALVSKLSSQMFGEKGELSMALALSNTAEQILKLGKMNGKEVTNEQLAKVLGLTDTAGRAVNEEAAVAVALQNFANVNSIAGGRYPNNLAEQFPLFNRQDFIAKLDKYGMERNGVYMNMRAIARMGGGDFDGDTIQLVRGRIQDMMRATFEKRVNDLGIKWDPEGKRIGSQDMPKSLPHSGEIQTGDIADFIYRQAINALELGAVSKTSENITQVDWNNADDVKQFGQAGLDAARAYDVSTTAMKTGKYAQFTEYMNKARFMGNHFNSLFKSMLGAAQNDKVEEFGRFSLTNFANAYSPMTMSILQSMQRNPLSMEQMERMVDYQNALDEVAKLQNSDKGIDIAKGQYLQFRNKLMGKQLATGALISNNDLEQLESLFSVWTNELESYRNEIDPETKRLLHPKDSDERKAQERALAQQARQLDYVKRWGATQRNMELGNGVFATDYFEGMRTTDADDAFAKGAQDYAATLYSNAAVGASDVTVGGIKAKLAKREREAMSQADIKRNIEMGNVGGIKAYNRTLKGSGGDNQGYSWSQLHTLETDPEEWYKHWVKGEPQQFPKLEQEAIMVGNAVHKIAENWGITTIANGDKDALAAIQMIDDKQYDYSSAEGRREAFAAKFKDELNKNIQLKNEYGNILPGEEGSKYSEAFTRRYQNALRFITELPETFKDFDILDTEKKVQFDWGKKRSMNDANGKVIETAEDVQTTGSADVVIRRKSDGQVYVLDYKSEIKSEGQKGYEDQQDQAALYTSRLRQQKGYENALYGIVGYNTKGEFAMDVGKEYDEKRAEAVNNRMRTAVSTAQDFFQAGGTENMLHQFFDAIQLVKDPNTGSRVPRYMTEEYQKNQFKTAREEIAAAAKEDESGFFRSQLNAIDEAAYHTYVKDEIAKGTGRGIAKSMQLENEISDFMKQQDSLFYALEKEGKEPAEREGKWQKYQAQVGKWYNKKMSDLDAEGMDDKEKNKISSQHMKNLAEYQEALARAVIYEPDALMSDIDEEIGELSKSKSQKSIEKARKSIDEKVKAAKDASFTYEQELRKKYVLDKSESWTEENLKKLDDGERKTFEDSNKKVAELEAKRDKYMQMIEANAQFEDEFAYDSKQYEYNKSLEKFRDKIMNRGQLPEKQKAVNQFTELQQDYEHSAEMFQRRANQIIENKGFDANKLTEEQRKELEKNIDYRNAQAGADYFKQMSELAFTAAQKEPEVFTQNMTEQIEDFGKSKSQKQIDAARKAIEKQFREAIAPINLEEEKLKKKYDVVGGWDYVGTGFMSNNDIRKFEEGRRKKEEAALKRNTYMRLLEDNAKFEEDFEYDAKQFEYDQQIQDYKEKTEKLNKPYSRDMFEKQASSYAHTADMYQRRVDQIIKNKGYDSSFISATERADLEQNADYRKAMAAVQQYRTLSDLATKAAEREPEVLAQYIKDQTANFGKSKSQKEIENARKAIEGQVKEATASDVKFEKEMRTKYKIGPNEDMTLMQNIRKLNDDEQKRLKTGQANIARLNAEKEEYMKYIEDNAQFNEELNYDERKYNYDRELENYRERAQRRNMRQPRGIITGGIYRAQELRRQYEKEAKQFTHQSEMYQRQADQIIKNKGYDKNNLTEEQIKDLNENIDFKNAQIGAEHFGQLANEASNAAQSVSTIGEVMNGLGQKISGLASMFGRRIFQRITSEVTQFARQYDTAMTTVQMITLKTDAEMEKINEANFDTAHRLKTDVTTVASVKGSLYRQGLTDEEVEERTDQVIKFAKVAGIKTETASKIMTTALKNGLVDSAQEAMDVLAALGDSAATTADEIQKALQKVAATASNTGIEYSELTALLTVALDKTQLSGNVVGTAMNTIMMRMRRVNETDYVKASNGEITTINDVDRALSRVGVSIRNENGQMKDTVEIMQELAKIWESIDDDMTKQNIVYAMAGRGSAATNTFYSLMDALGENGGQDYLDALATANNSEGIVNEKYLAYMDSYNAKLTDLKTNIQAAGESLVSSGFMSGIMDIASFLGGAAESMGAFGTIAVAVIAKVGTSLLSMIASAKAAGRAASASMGVVGLVLTLAAGAGVGIAGAINNKQQAEQEKAIADEAIMNAAAKRDGEAAAAKTQEEIKTINDEYKTLTELYKQYGKYGKDFQDHMDAEDIRKFESAIESLGKVFGITFTEDMKKALEQMDDFKEIMDYIRRESEKYKNTMSMNNIVEYFSNSKGVVYGGLGEKNIIGYRNRTNSFNGSDWGERDATINQTVYDDIAQIGFEKVLEESGIEVDKIKYVYSSIGDYDEASESGIELETHAATDPNKVNIPVRLMELSPGINKNLENYEFSQDKANEVAKTYLTTINYKSIIDRIFGENASQIDPGNEMMAIGMYYWLDKIMNIDVGGGWTYRKQIMQNNKTDDDYVRFLTDLISRRGMELAGFSEQSDYDSINDIITKEMLDFVESGTLKSEGLTFRLLNKDIFTSAYNSDSGANRGDFNTEFNNYRKQIVYEIKSNEVDRLDKAITSLKDEYLQYIKTLNDLSLSETITEYENGFLTFEEFYNKTSDKVADGSAVKLRAEQAINLADEYQDKRSELIDMEQQGYYSTGTIEQLDSETLTALYNIDPNEAYKYYTTESGGEVLSSGLDLAPNEKYRYSKDMNYIQAKIDMRRAAMEQDLTTEEGRSGFLDWLNGNADIKEYLNSISGTETGAKLEEAWNDRNAEEMVRILDEQVYAQESWAARVNKLSKTALSTRKELNAYSNLINKDISDTDLKYLTDRLGYTPQTEEEIRIQARRAYTDTQLEYDKLPSEYIELLTLEGLDENRIKTWRTETGGWNKSLEDYINTAPMPEESRQRMQAIMTAANAQGIKIETDENGKIVASVKDYSVAPENPLKSYDVKSNEQLLKTAKEYMKAADQGQAELSKYLADNPGAAAIMSGNWSDIVKYYNLDPKGRESLSGKNLKRKIDIEIAIAGLTDLEEAGQILSGFTKTVEVMIGQDKVKAGQTTNQLFGEWDSFNDVYMLYQKAVGGQRLTDEEWTKLGNYLGIDTDQYKANPSSIATTTNEAIINGTVTQRERSAKEAYDKLTDETEKQAFVTEMGRRGYTYENGVFKFDSSKIDTSLTNAMTEENAAGYIAAAEALNSAALGQNANYMKLSQQIQGKTGTTKAITGVFNEDLSSLLQGAIDSGELSAFYQGDGKYDWNAVSSYFWRKSLGMEGVKYDTRNENVKRYAEMLIGGKEGFFDISNETDSAALENAIQNYIGADLYEQATTELKTNGVLSNETRKALGKAWAKALAGEMNLTGEYAAEVLSGVTALTGTSSEARTQMFAYDEQRRKLAKYNWALNEWNAGEIYDQDVISALMEATHAQSEDQLRAMSAKDIQVAIQDESMALSETMKGVIESLAKLNDLSFADDFNWGSDLSDLMEEAEAAGADWLVKMIKLFNDFNNNTTEADAGYKTLKQEYEASVKKDRKNRQLLREIYAASSTGDEAKLDTLRNDTKRDRSSLMQYPALVAAMLLGDTFTNNEVSQLAFDTLTGGSNKQNDKIVLEKIAPWLFDETMSQEEMQEKYYDMITNNPEGLEILNSYRSVYGEVDGVIKALSGDATECANAVKKLNEAFNNDWQEAEAAGEILSGFSSTIETIVGNDKVAAGQQKNKTRGDYASFSDVYQLYQMAASGQRLTDEQWTTLGDFLGISDINRYKTNPASIATVNNNATMQQAIQQREESAAYLRKAFRSPKEQILFDRQMAESGYIYQSDGSYIFDPDQIQNSGVMSRRNAKAYVSNAEALNKYIREQSGNYAKLSQAASSAEDFDTMIDNMETAGVLSMFNEAVTSGELSDMYDEATNEYDRTALAQYFARKGMGLEGARYDTKNSDVQSYMRMLLGKKETQAGFLDISKATNSEALIATMQSYLGSDLYEQVETELRNGGLTDDTQRAVRQAWASAVAKELNLTGEYSDEVLSGISAITGSDRSRRAQMLSYDAQQSTIQRYNWAYEQWQAGNRYDQNVVSALMEATGAQSEAQLRRMSEQEIGDAIQDSVTAFSDTLKGVLKAGIDSAGIEFDLDTGSLDDLRQKAIDAEADWLISLIDMFNELNLNGSNAGYRTLEEEYESSVASKRADRALLNEIYALSAKGDTEGLYELMYGKEVVARDADGNELRDEEGLPIMERVMGKDVSSLVRDNPTLAGAMLLGRSNEEINALTLESITGGTNYAADESILREIAPWLFDTEMSQEDRLAAYNGMEGLPLDIVESYASKYGEVDQVIKSLNGSAINTEEAVGSLNDKFREYRVLARYGEEGQDVNDVINSYNKNARTAIEVTGRLITKSNSLAYSQKMLNSARGKSGKQLEKNELEELSSLFGISQEEIENMGAKTINSLIDGAQAAINEQGKSELMQPVLGEIEEELQKLSDDERLTLSQKVGFDVAVDGQSYDLSQLQAMADALNLSCKDVLAQLLAEGYEAVAVFDSGENSVGYHFELQKLGIGTGGVKSGGGGGGGGKSKIQAFLDDLKRKLTISDHEIKMIQAQEKKYESLGELGNVNNMLEIENIAQNDYIDRLNDAIDEIKAKMQTVKKDSDDWYSLRDAVMSYEEAIEEANQAIIDNNKKMKENRMAILKTKTDIEDAIRSEADAREQLRRSMLSATVDMEDQILTAIRDRYQDEWDLMQKDIQKKRSALEEEKSLIDERLQRRKEAEDEAKKYEELAEYERQMALISMDPTRSRDRMELAEKIAELQRDLAWSTAEQEARAQQNALDDQLAAYDEFVNIGNEDLQAFLEDANNFTAEVNDVLQMSYEDMMEWLKANVDEYQLALDEQQQNMVEGWTDTFKQMYNIVETYYDLIQVVMAGGKDLWIAYMQESQDYINATPDMQAQMLQEWLDMWDDMIAAYQEGATYSHTDDWMSYGTSSSSGGSGGSGGGGGGNNNDEAYNSFLKTLLEKMNINFGSGLLAGSSIFNNLALSQKKYASGGLVDYTGPAWVDGTPSAPESFLDAEDTKLLRSMLEASKYIGTSFKMSYIGEDMFDRNSTSIGEVNVTINEAKIESDQDIDELAGRVGESFAKELAINGFHLTNMSF